MKEQLQIGLFDWVEASDTRTPAETFAHKLALAAAADKAGFHAYMLAEHQGTPLSIDSSPAVLLSAMIQRTGRLRLGALTFCLPWYNPYRFYNEVCMLDQLSHGRLELGIGRGVSPIESQIYGLKSIEESRPSSNKESIEFTASHGYHTAFLGKLADCKPHFDRYREIWEQHRNDPGRHNAHVAMPFLAKSQHLVIAETDAQAERLGLEAYAKWSSHIHHLTRKLGRPDVHKNDPYAEDSAHRLITGSPRVALEKLQEMLAVTSANYLLCIFSFGDLPPQAALRSLELFAHEVMPAL